MAIESLIRAKLSARLLRDRRLLHPRGRAQAQGPARSELEHGRSVHQPAGRSAPGGRAARHAIRARNQHIIVITDGQPTAYFSGAGSTANGRSASAASACAPPQETLKEVERVTRRGITINTFMLDDSPSLRAFVERMTRINKRPRALHAAGSSRRVPARRLPRTQAQEDLTRLSPAALTTRRSALPFQ